MDGRPGPAADRDVARGGRLVRRLEQRCVDDPEEAPRRLVDEVAAPADLEPCGAEQRTGGLDRARGEEHAVPGPGADVSGQAGALLLAEVLGDRAAELAVVLDEHVGETAGTPLLRPV